MTYNSNEADDKWRHTQVLKEHVGYGFPVNASQDMTRILTPGRVRANALGERYNIAEQVAQYTHRIEYMFMLLFLPLFVEQVGLNCFAGKSDRLL